MLYEVITPFRWGKVKTGSRKDIAEGFAPTGINRSVNRRITSYNVCYTKLLRLTGACRGCPMSQITLKEGIEKFLKSEVPEIAAVEAV